MFCKGPAGFLFHFTNLCNKNTQSSLRTCSSLQVSFVRVDVLLPTRKFNQKNSLETFLFLFSLHAAQLE